MSGRKMEKFDKNVDTELEDYEYFKNGTFEDEDFEKELQLEEMEEQKGEQLKSHTSIKIERGLVRAFRAFRNSVASLKHGDPQDLDVYLIATAEPKLNLEITRALRKGDAIPKFHVLTATKQEAREVREKSGIEHVFKGDPSRRRLSERADIVAVMDRNAEISWRTLRNIEPGGWLLIPIEQANTARTEGLLFKGIIERDGAYPSVQREGSDFWKKIEIEKDEDLKNAKAEDGVVTYQEAALAVWNAYGKSDDIVENYKRLIEAVKKQHPEAVLRGETELTYTIERDGKVIEVPVNLVLPLKDQEHGKNNFAIFRKKPAA